MKYLKYELYEKLCAVEVEQQYEDKWEAAYSEYLKEFDQILSRLPKRFLKEYKKKGFHDNILNFISIEKIEVKKGYKYLLNLNLLDYYEKNVIHNLVFSNVIKFKSNLDFSYFVGNCDWRYCEILPVDEKKLSLEVVLFDDSVLYFEFSKMHYKKVKLQTLKK